MLYTRCYRKVCNFVLKNIIFLISEIINYRFLFVIKTQVRLAACNVELRCFEKAGLQFVRKTFNSY